MNVQAYPHRRRRATVTLTRVGSLDDTDDGSETGSDTFAFHDLSLSARPDDNVRDSPPAATSVVADARR